MELPLLYLFVDMNAYFASVEQELNPSLRGKPIAVAPVVVNSSCCIAASYEAKNWGIKTGTRVGEAHLLCPGLIVVQARPRVYVEMHHRIVDAVESCFHVDSVLSIDEMIGVLSVSERNPSKARALGNKIKHAIRSLAGRTLCCSVGIAPNRFLAKVAAEMQKPDGLTIIQGRDLPDILYSLKLTDLPGIGARMEVRLLSYGVSTIKQLYKLSEHDLGQIWGSVVGRRWWYHLRGYDLPVQETARSSVGHSHVLPPEFRTEAGAYAVLLRLVHKAACRLRAYCYWTERFSASVRYMNRALWHDDVQISPCQDTLTLVEILNELWRKKEITGTPIKVSVTLSNLIASESVTRSLFPEREKRLLLARAMDELNHKFGNDTIYLAGIYTSRNTAPERIAFTSIPEFE
jgi:DNA polymerase IV